MALAGTETGVGQKTQERDRSGTVKAVPRKTVLLLLQAGYLLAQFLSYLQPLF